MKFNVFFLSKKYLYIGLVLLLLIISTPFILKFFLSKESIGDSIPVISKKEMEKGIKGDFNGDGLEDVLYTTTKDGKYYISVNINDKNYMLSPDKTIGSLGKEYPYWGIRIFIKDISRDGIPEIFLQSSQEGTPISHIFKWNGVDFSNIYFSKNNLVGILNSKNNKTPRYFSGSVVNGSLSFESYMLIGNKFKDISKDNFSFPGKDEIITLIDNIENPYEPDSLPEIFSESLPKSDTAIFWKLEKDIYTYALQDGFFIDHNWDSSGNISSIMWELNFKRTEKVTSSPDKNITIRVMLNNSENKYVISSLNSSL